MQLHTGDCMGKAVGVDGVAQRHRPRKIDCGLAIAATRQAGTIGLKVGKGLAEKTCSSRRNLCVVQRTTVRLWNLTAWLKLLGFQTES